MFHIDTILIYAIIKLSQGGATYEQKQNGSINRKIRTKCKIKILIKLIPTKNRNIVNGHSVKYCNGRAYKAPTHLKT
jgi:hypothetical protein